MLAAFRTPEKLFLLIALVFGVAYALIIPPMRAPDERGHMQRIIAYVQGELWQYPEDKGLTAYSDIAVKRAERVHNGDAAVRFSGADILSALTSPSMQHEEAMTPPFNKSTAMNSPVPYLPAILAIAPAYYAGVPPGTLLYIGRIALMLAGIALIYAAIRITPVMPWTFCFVGLMPMALFIRSSLSADTVTIGLAFCYIAFVLRLLAQESPITHRSLVMLGFVLILLMLCKLAIMPLALLVLLFGPKIRSQIGYALLLVAGPFLALLWSVEAKHHLMQFTGDMWGNHRYPAGQIAEIIAYPFSYFMVLLRSLGSPDFWWEGLCREFVGVLGLLDRPLPVAIVTLYFAALAFVVYSEPKGMALSRMQRVLSLGIFVTTMAMIMTLLYIQWTPYLAPVITGYQGRYIYPFVLLLLIAIAPKKSCAAQRLPVLVVAVSSIGLLAGLWEILALDYR